jgi:C4-dicarboxylate-specific signal transduction histidine kinase
MEPVCLVSAVDGALALVQGHLRNDGIAVETHLPRDLPLVRGRLVLIESVLVNLCVNARDAMRQVPVESRVLRIEASTRPQGRVELRVIDQGGGIPAAVMPRLFEPFFTTKSPGEGTGLGLSISHGMMQTMGGGLAVTNTGSGACFVLTLRAVVPEGQACLASSAGGAMTFVHHDA